MQPFAPLFGLFLLALTVEGGLWRCSQVHEWVQTEGGLDADGLGFGAWQDPDTGDNYVKYERYEDCPSPKYYAASNDCSWNAAKLSRHFWHKQNVKYGTVGGWFNWLVGSKDKGSWHFNTQSAICWLFAHDVGVVVQKGEPGFSFKTTGGKKKKYSAPACPLLLRDCAKDEGMKGSGNGYSKCVSIKDKKKGYLATEIGWTCDESKYNDGKCDCKCGAWDPDCGDGQGKPFVTTPARGCGGDTPYCNPVFMGVRCSRIANGDDRRETDTKTSSSWTSQVKELAKEQKISIPGFSGTSESREVTPDPKVTKALAKSLAVAKKLNREWKPKKSEVKKPKLFHTFKGSVKTKRKDVLIKFDVNRKQKVDHMLEFCDPADIRKVKQPEDKETRSIIGRLATALRQSSGSSGVTSGVVVGGSARSSEASSEYIISKLAEIETVAASQIIRGSARALKTAMKVVAKGASALRRVADALIYHSLQALGFCKDMTLHQCSETIIQPMFKHYHEAVQEMGDKPLTVIMSIGGAADAVLGVDAGVGVYFTKFKADSFQFDFGVLADAEASFGTTLGAGVHAYLSMSILFAGMEEIEKNPWKVSLGIDVDVGFHLGIAVTINLRNVPELDVWKADGAKEAGQNLKDMIKKCAGLPLTDTNITALEPTYGARMNKNCFLGFGVTFSAGVGVGLSNPDLRISRSVWGKSASLISNVDPLKGVTAGDE